MPNCPAAFLIALCILAFTPLKIAHAESGDPEPAQLLRPFPEPSEVVDPPWLTRRQQAQLAAAQAYESFATSPLPTSLELAALRFAIGWWRNSGKSYIPVHYDHGNGPSRGGCGWRCLYDLYFATQVGSNQLWRNRGEARFENYTTPSLALADRIGVSASFGDIDNDGDVDLYVTAVRLGNRLLVNDGTGRFEDITAHSARAGRRTRRPVSSSTTITMDAGSVFDQCGIYTQDEQ